MGIARILLSDLARVIDRGDISMRVCASKSKNPSLDVHIQLCRLIRLYQQHESRSAVM